MASQIEICNLALVIHVGEAPILSLLDNSKPARSLNAIYNSQLEMCLRRANWCFAMKRTGTLPALVSTPEYQFDFQYQLPSDCLRIVQVNEIYVGADYTDYLNVDGVEYYLEGRQILTNDGAPLKLRYVASIADPQQYDPLFVSYFAAHLGYCLCEPLSQSSTKKEGIEKEREKLLNEAKRCNAIEKAPAKLPANSWEFSRL